MALPLKSGADLYTQELLRARLHNFDGDLAEYGTGSIYFNTTSGLNTSDRIRYRGLAGWHSVANLEDIARLEEMIGNLNFAGSEDFIGITSRVSALEGNFTNGAAKDAVKFGGQLPSYYATQSAFSALQEKVNAFLDGDADSDAVLENLKEIQTFLDSYDGATSLVDLLKEKADKSQLSGYLPLSGGTLNGGLTVPTLTISSQDAVKHIAFSRAAVNYIHAPSGGYMAFVVNGQNVINANAEMIISDGIIYAGTDNVTQLGYGEKRWSGVYSYAGDFAGQVTANTILASSVVACGGRLRINTSNSVNSFGFLKATAHTNALNRAVMHIGSNYGGSENITTESVDVVAMSIYRGVLGIGKEYTYDELYANYDNAISLMVANNMSVNGRTYVNGNITTNSNIGIGTAAPTQKLDVRGNQYITGYIYADGDLHTGQWLKTSTGVAFGSAHTLTFNSYSIISNAELSFTNISTTDISTGIKAAIKAGLMQINDIIGHRIFLGNNTAGTASNQPFSICTYSGVSNYAPANVTELFRVDPAGEVTIKKDLIVEGNVIAYGQVSSGGVAEEGTGVGGSLERVTFTIPANTTTFECEHNLGTKEISVSIYEEGGDYQQILADVYLDSTNIARIVFGRATDVAHKVVIIG